MASFPVGRAVAQHTPGLFGGSACKAARVSLLLGTRSTRPWQSLVPISRGNQIADMVGSTGLRHAHPCLGYEVEAARSAAASTGPRTPP